MNLADLFHRTRWQIVSVDPQVAVFLEGQYQPDEGWVDDKPPILSAAVTPGSEAPSTQWVAGGPRVVRIRSSFVSKHFLDDIRPQRRMLESLRDRDSVLGRAPRVRLTWGDLEVVGFVSRLTVRTVGYWVTGKPKVVAFELELTESEVLLIDLGDALAGLTGETQFVTLRGGETFEALGRRYYGRADKGDLIRRENPKHADQEEAGDVVKVLEAEHVRVRRVVVEPSGVPFLGDGWEDIVEDIAEERDSSSGLPWALQPEVLAGEV